MMKKTGLLAIFVGMALLSACAFYEAASPQAASSQVTIDQTPASIPPSPNPKSAFTPMPTPSPIPLCSLGPAEADRQCREDSGKGTRSCVPVSSSEAVWACYEDLVYGFAIDYPAEWRVEIGMDTGLSDDTKIARRHSFWGPQGALDIDIWRPSNPDLIQWLTRNKDAIGPDAVPLTEPNARVSGYPAVAFMDNPQSPNPMLTIYVSNGRFVYRFWFTLQCDREEMSVIRRMLDSLRFSAQTVPAEIPGEVWQEVQRAFEPPRCAPSS
ncbi:MAG: hypothetical protein H5T61_00065 [Thermoflexales bacterium]|nr:hypothetical protein [Thermoflexales bacterium]